MALDELDKILADDDKGTSQAPSGEKPQEPKKDDEVLKKEQHLENLNKAIQQANEQLSTARKAIKTVKQPEEDEDIPKIDMEDPSSKAWSRHIQQSVAPVQTEIDKEKEEIRTFALQSFLADKPSLAGDTEKVKQLVSMYERVRTATERTVEGVLLDLEAAYAAVHNRELAQQNRARRIAQARAEEQFSDAAVSRGATAYSHDSKPAPEKVPAEWQDTVARWDKTLAGMGYGEKK